MRHAQLRIRPGASPHTRPPPPPPAPQIDDPLDAIAVHAGCGMWGLIAVAAFAKREYTFSDDAVGFIMGGNGKLLGAQLVYIVCIVLWTLGIMTPFFMLLKKLNLFRVAPEVESAGLDVSHHGGSAYPHEKAGKAAEMGSMMTPEMVDLKINEVRGGSCFFFLWDFSLPATALAPKPIYLPLSDHGLPVLLSLCHRPCSATLRSRSERGAASGPARRCR